MSFSSCLPELRLSFPTAPHYTARRNPRRTVSPPAIAQITTTGTRITTLAAIMKLVRSVYGYARLNETDLVFRFLMKCQNETVTVELKNGASVRFSQFLETGFAVTAGACWFASRVRHHPRQRKPWITAIIYVKSVAKLTRTRHRHERHHRIRLAAYEHCPPNGQIHTPRPQHGHPRHHDRPRLNGPIHHSPRFAAARYPPHR